ncbi:Fe-S cluster assembly ATPase SufC [Patescibacteria group bacterium]
MNKILQLKNLEVQIEGQKIIKGLNLDLVEGSVNALMGPNGSGKSTLANAISGHPAYTVSRGSIIYQGKNIAKWPADKRAKAGIFLAMQSPSTVPGVTIIDLLRAAVNARRPEGKKIHFLKMPQIVEDKMKLLELEKSFLERSVNEGFSGGEKKRAEILQLAVLEPRLAVLDETDSGLDIDALRIVATGINKIKKDKQTILLITHYQRILEYIKPDFVHIMYQGRIIKSGDEQLATKLEKEGYDWIINKS